MELVGADHRSLSVDEFDARFNRARPRVRAVARSILGEPLGNGDYRVEGMSIQMGGYWIVDVTVTYDGQTDLVSRARALSPAAPMACARGL